MLTTWMSWELVFASSSCKVGLGKNSGVITWNHERTASRPVGGVIPSILTVTSTNKSVSEHLDCITHEIPSFNGLLCQLNVPSEPGCVLTHAIPGASSTDPHKKHQLSTPGFQHITWVEIPSESPQIMETQMPTATRGCHWQ